MILLSMMAYWLSGNPLKVRRIENYQKTLTHPTICHTGRSIVDFPFFRCEQSHNLSSH